MSLSDFKALSGPACPPSLVYFHENQFSYPLAPGEQMDYQFGFTDITTALAAERVVFNSRTHREAFFSGMTRFLKMMPDHAPRWVVEQIRSKSGVLYPGCRFPAGEMTLSETPAREAPLIIWNHRWEFDKNPEDFFGALDALLADGRDFRLALLGETSRSVPKPFESARERYGRRIVHYGYEPSREAYLQWLGQGEIVISTAVQENFGISVIEAIRFGCIPLLPNRLSYPEIIPERFHRQVLYADREDLQTRLAALLGDGRPDRTLRKELAESMGRFAWDNGIDRFDGLLEALADR
jgi:glycosyltransferase involved in cell wall biosynthesis